MDAHLWIFIAKNGGLIPRRLQHKPIKLKSLSIHCPFAAGIIYFILAVLFLASSYLIISVLTFS